MSRISSSIIGRRLCLAGLLAITLGTLQALAAASPDADAVRQTLMAKFDRPDARLEVRPVVVAGDHALAGWMQGDRGGRALLRRAHGHWQIAVCGGDALREPQVLEDAGVPHGNAAALASDLRRAEQDLTPAQRKLLASFEGLMPMDGGEHPPHH